MQKCASWGCFTRRVPIMEERFEIGSNHEERSHIGEQTVVEGATQRAAWTNGEAPSDSGQPVMSGMDQLWVFVMQRYVTSVKKKPELSSSQ